MHNAMLKRLMKSSRKQLKGQTGALLFQILLKVVQDCPYDWATPILGAIRGRQVESLIARSAQLVSQKYETPAEHRWAHQIAALIRKYPWPGKDSQAELNAWKKFQRDEVWCRRINKIIRARESSYDRESAFLQSMRNYIQFVLGLSPSLDTVYSLCDFGPGASIGVGGDATSFARKLCADTVTATPGATALFITSLASNHQIFELALNSVCEVPFSPWDEHDRKVILSRWLDGRLKFVDYNKITFVPKTCDMKRSIAVEPTGNGFVQKGVDQFMRRRLRTRAGLDLRDQETNQKLAYLGSRDWETDNAYCTIDLSSASDNISRELVRSLLPNDWFRLLDTLRCPNYMYRSNKFRYEKFSSMGNGFTFPLQTLIFASVCAAASNEAGVPFDFRVYGDDIIVRRCIFDRVTKMLRWCGFKTNPKKTFSTGPFRESCGKDYFGGVDVRPITLDEPLDTIQKIIGFHNLLGTLSDQFLWVGEVQELLRSSVPPLLRFVRPYKGPVDTAFEVELDVFMASSFATRSPQYQSWGWTEFVTSAREDSFWKSSESSNQLLLIAALRGSPPDVPFAFRRKTALRARKLPTKSSVLPKGWDAFRPQEELVPS